MNVCERCGRDVHPGEEVWVEMSVRGYFVDDNSIPEEESQGCFLYGKTCAKRVVEETAHLRRNGS